MKYFIYIILAMALTSCTQYTRELNISVEDGGTLTIGDVEVLAEVSKGDENQTNTPDLKLDIPISGL